MISSQEKDGEFINNICLILQHYPQNFKGLGELRNYQLKLYTDNSIKPVAVTPRSVPYHFKGRVSDTIDNMLKEGGIEEHTINDPSPWVSCAVIVPKTEGSIRITLDARSLNKAIISTNQPIPKKEDIRAQLAGERFLIQYKKGITNLADYLSRHGIPWETLPKNEKNESSDLTNLLYTMHVTPILDAIGIKKIAKETNNDPTL